MKALKPNANTVYYLALLDWREIILSPEAMSKFTDDIIPSPSPPTDGWIICPLNWPNLKDKVINMVMGYYHSRLIFRFDLVSAPRDIFEVRRLRKRLENEVRKFLSDTVIKAMKSHVNVPRIFIYPIFELRSREVFWKFSKQKPYSLSTTCFYTELDDPKGRKYGWIYNTLSPKKVQIRVSGVKIITSEMSDWFFLNLTNIVFHEGLYRQTREKERFNKENVYPGLENRLEDFASSLMTMFYELSSSRVQDSIARYVLALTVLGSTAAFITIIQYILPWLLQIFRPADPNVLDIFRKIQW